MKILFVGNCNHYFNRKLVQNLKEFNTKLEIDFFSIIKPDEKLYLPYDHVFDYSVNRQDLNFIFKLPKIFSWYCYRFWNRSIKFFIKTRYYDYIHIQSLGMYNIGIEDLHEKIIITIWGSDFLRISKIKLLNYSKLVEKASKITFATIEISSSFDQVFHTKHKHLIIKFGLTVFEHIDKLRGCYKKANDKITIVIGYNGHPAQQHLKILKEIGKIKKELKDKIKLILPLTYGLSGNKYLAKLQSALDKLSIEHELYLTFLNESEMAELCLTSDLFLQLQTTDAFSGSMQEFMYAGSIVITGLWLNYAELRNNKVNFTEISDFSELAPIIEKKILNIELERIRTNGNDKALYNISSWDKNIGKWNALYE